MQFIWTFEADKIIMGSIGKFTCGLWIIHNNRLEQDSLIVLAKLPASGLSMESLEVHKEIAPYLFFNYLYDSILLWLTVSVGKVVDWIRRLQENHSPFQYSILPDPI